MLRFSLQVIEIVNFILSAKFLITYRVLASLQAEQEKEPTEIFSSPIEPLLFASKRCIHFPLPDTDSIMEKVLQFTSYVCLLIK